ncbi:MAG: hypothetical protein NTY48_07105 [Candidatus Diapherotrites archaeon]|nr:hypothetical protein [Candidatus Diapherotrites archaeon]
MDYKGQSALEYLMTYGWALIVIAIVIGVLIFVTSGATGGVTCQSKSTSLQLTEWSVKAGTSGIGFTLRNATGGTITPTGAVGPLSDTNAAALVATVANASTFTVTGLNAPAAGTNLSNSSTTVSYVTAGGLPASATIVCNGTL